MQLYSKWIAGAILGSCALMPMSGFAASNFEANRTDFRDETIYFAITTRFYDGDPMNNVLCWDGVEHQKANNDPAWRGDFAGLIQKLDYIKALGFTAIWITPVVQNASGYDYHGYHAMDFSKVDLRYESRTEWGCAEDVKFEDFIKAAHEKGIKVILDIVLQHTGNFGENKFCKLFERDQNIKNQADIESCLIPDEEKLGGQSYWDLPNEGDRTQYKERFKYIKNTDGQNHDDKNYWHHVSTSWNWDLPNRWWGQIAGDCVDLNTENPAVVDYIAECYEKFIAMGVDGFRIDTTGHIAPLTFNSAFIPRFTQFAETEEGKKNRLNHGSTPFYMFGECCARYGSVIYREQHVLSSHYYTWKSDPALVTEWKSFSADWWANQFVKEGAEPLGNMLTCEKDPGTVHNSKNVFMQNGAWHEPDYSEASGFNVIDFPMHYNFNSAEQAVNIAKSGDHFYNDASWNVVYVDSHDYCPGPNDGVRFTGGTEQWAENLSLMFTFRGIPCIYYGSEVEFQKGKTIDEGPALASVNSGRAYYGEYLEGNVNATDFGVYTADGNVSKTLDGDLAHHVRRLNQIRQACPALRKGQYTWDGCSANGGWAFKRAYKDSYALVAINGGATFSNVPAGTYTDLVTGKKYNGGGTITVSAPSNKGQLRVLVKDWTGEKVGDDGKFMYDQSPKSHGGSVTFPHKGTTHYYTKEDAPGPSIATVSFSPAGGSFKTETQSVTVTLSDASVSGWYQVAGQSRVNLSPSNRTSTFTIGNGMNFGETITVNWGATDAEGQQKTGSVTYKKVDPNAVITVYVKSPNGNGNIYAWDNGTPKKEPYGAWPGAAISSGERVVVGDDTYYGFMMTDCETVNVIFNNGGAQTGNIEGITEDTYFDYDGGSTANKIENVNPIPQASVIFNPNGGNFSEDVITVTATAKNATSAWYKIGNGAQQNFSNTASFQIGSGMSDGDSVTVSWGATNNEGTTRTGNVTFTKKINGGGNDEPEGNLVIYYDNSFTNWNTVKVHFWGGSEATQWSGNEMTKLPCGHYYYSLPEGTNGLVFNNGSGDQTNDVTTVTHKALYKGTGNRNFETGTHSCAPSGVGYVFSDEDAPAELYNLQGVRVTNPGPGIYIAVKGKKSKKIIIR